MTKRVVVTGVGLVTPLGCRVEDVWQSLCAGKSGIRSITDGPLSVFRTKVAGFCDDFVAEDYVSVKDTHKLDRFTLFALASAIDAVRASGLDFSKENPFRCGVITGCGVGGLGEITRQQDRLRTMGPGKISPYTIPKIMANAGPGQIAIRYGLHGPTYSIATACASANSAMSESFRAIRLGEADVVITGGTESAVTELGLAGFCSMRALSERPVPPEEASSPFDAKRDGFVIGEGAGILVFEELQHAKKRGAPILGEVLGYGATTDASHITQPDADGVYPAEAMRAALRCASLAPEELDYINLHGTATKLGDLAETSAIKRALGDHAYKIPMSSTKSHIGHLLGGSGGPEAIFSLLTMRDGIAPPTINLTEPDPQCDLDYVPLKAREISARRVMSNSFGFGGHNVCVIFGKFQ